MLRIADWATRQLLPAAEGEYYDPPATRSELAAVDELPDRIDEAERLPDDQ
ncbi:hypothetical protein ACFQZ2_02925 [Streptomonospora algeriensis]|uniref:Uncharacterized protein n=1 Tax=Streptomonospora algeriensis TaxID=995084 RepID=A0ABW3BIV8_9ACTN